MNNPLTTSTALRDCSTSRPVVPAREAIELALNLDRIYRCVAAYPQISEVPNTLDATEDEVLAGYERIKRNRHLRPMCVTGEKRVRSENRRAIEALCKWLGVAS